MFSAAFVCLLACVFVCQHDNFRTSKRRMMKLGGRSTVAYKNLGRFRMWGRSPLSAHPPNVALGYDVGKISAGCL